MSRGRGAETSPPLLYSAHKGDGEQAGSQSQGKRKPYVRPGSQRGDAYRRVEGKNPSPSESLVPLEGAGITPSFSFPSPASCRGLRTSSLYPPAPGHCFSHFPPAPTSELMLLTVAGAGWIRSGWKVCISQASGAAQKRPS